MKNPLSQIVLSKNLYFVTLRNVSIGVKMLGVSVCFFGDKQYTFAKRLSNGNYIDIFTGALYHPYDDPSLGSGDLALSAREPIHTKHVFLSKSVLQETLNEINEPGKRMIKR